MVKGAEHLCSAQDGAFIMIEIAIRDTAMLARPILVSMDLCSNLRQKVNGLDFSSPL
jgi:hypothetical protein